MSNIIQVVALDLDGTLLNSKHQISSYNSRVLHALTAMGIEIMLCTGRPYRAMKTYYDQLDLESPLICFNGAQIVNSQGEPLLQTTLSHRISQRLVEIGKERGVYTHGFIDDRWLVSELTDAARDYQERSGLKAEVVDFTRIEPLHFIKLMYIADPAELNPLYDQLTNEFGDEIYKAFSWATFLEVLNKDSSKAKALGWYLEYQGLSRENLLVMGDGGNDMDMLEFAGIGVAMENASDQVKGVANRVAPHHEDNGVGRFLADFFKINIT